MVERRVIAIEGVVQGVGFRPFVHRLATALHLRGVVRNDAGGVTIDVEGERTALDDLLRSLTSSPPPLAAIDSVHLTHAPPGAYEGFVIDVSDDGPRSERRPLGEGVALVSPDVATCDACLAELLDPGNRRYRYPLTNCTNCGPRLTIVRGTPYDRPRTTMAAFAMCDACRREYEDPRDRRFHAQPIACHDCGPTVALREPGGGPAAPVSGERAIAQTVAALLDGRIVAVKGLGGYHLACDATDGSAVRRLRARKAREAKPFAVMVADVQAARSLCRVDEREAALLSSPERPIVLVAKRSPSSAIGVVHEVAPANRELGVMLPSTPLHHLLLRGVGRPLVMTSGNRASEPIAFADADAFASLAGIADLFLTHDRPIATRCDDSVVRVLAGPDGVARSSFVRRSRGFAPRPIRLAAPCRVPVLGAGGHLKNTFCLAKGRSAFLSHHVGDLESAEASQAWHDGVAHYGRLLDVRPDMVAHDFHPDYLSTEMAHQLPAATRLAVQHHHAHVASCMAEHGVTEPVIGVAFDGAGLGIDRAIWGGEFLLVDGAGFERLAHLGYVPLPGGDAAVRHPWRTAAAQLWAAYGTEIERLPIPFLERADPGQWSLVQQMLARGVRCPPTSSAGRLFDAVASLVGLRDASQFEGQAAMELEACADPGTGRSYPVEFREVGGGWTVELAPLIRCVVDDVAARRPAAEIAGTFHNAVRDLIVEVVQRIRRRTGVRRVALSGGVFQNRMLTERSAGALARHGFEVLVHRQVPCNDGGLSLGQAYVAALAAHGGQGTAPSTPRSAVGSLVGQETRPCA